MGSADPCSGKVQLRPPFPSGCQLPKPRKRGFKCNNQKPSRAPCSSVILMQKQKLWVTGTQRRCLKRGLGRKRERELRHKENELITGSEVGGLNISPYTEVYWDQLGTRQASPVAREGTYATGLACLVPSWSQSTSV